LPGSVSALLLLLRIKFAARAVGASRVAINDNGELSLTFEGEAEPVRQKVMAFMESSSSRFAVADNPPQTILKTELVSTSKSERVLETLAIVQKKK
jgi:hypothetical protein